jgi:hypothetical protein
VNEEALTHWGLLHEKKKERKKFKLRRNMQPPEMKRVSQRRQCPSTRLHGITARKTIILIFIVVGKSKQIQIVLIVPAERCDINIETNRE